MGSGFKTEALRGKCREMDGATLTLSLPNSQSYWPLDHIQGFLQRFIEPWRGISKWSPTPPSRLALPFQGV